MAVFVVFLGEHLILWLVIATTLALLMIFSYVAETISFGYFKKSFVDTIVKIAFCVAIIFILIGFFVRITSTVKLPGEYRTPREYSPPQYFVPRP
ncbi:MAG: hypothetical protein Q7S28_03385 [bacterium]|nr:hypothetical protein [bacterium]